MRVESLAGWIWSWIGNATRCSGNVRARLFARVAISTGELRTVEGGVGRVLAGSNGLV